MKKLIATEDCVKKFRKIHGDKYDYSEVIYNGSNEKIKIICPVHGVFYQTPNKHLMGRGCPYCSGNIRKTTEQCIADFKKIHGNKYDYSLVRYEANNKKVEIICPTHGIFKQTPSIHLKGCGCPKCGKENSSVKLSKKFALNKDEFVSRAKKIHGDLYSYDKVEYANMKSKVLITCKVHGDYTQTACDHLKGYGCPKCKLSKLEKEIEHLLQEVGVKFEQQKKFDWLGRQTLDFYLPDYNIAIECQGIQHFKPVKYFGGNKKFDYIALLDKRKYELCEENGIKLIYYSSDNVCQNNGNIITDKDKLLNYM